MNLAHYIPGHECFLSAGSASRPADQWPIWAQVEEGEEGREKGHFVKIRHLEVREALEHR